MIRAGITPEMHASGRSIKKARGHEHTPESPKQAVKSEQNRMRYREYLNRRAELERQVIEKKARLFGDRTFQETNKHHKQGEKSFNKGRSEKYAKKNPSTNRAPKMANMRAFLSDDWEESDWDKDDDEWGFLYYR
jgi:hypothetical protein